MPSVFRGPVAFRVPVSEGYADEGEAMSYWVYLSDDEGTVGVANHSEGGTYAIGGMPRAELNVTYNYARFFDFRALDGQKAADTVEHIGMAVQQLGTERDPDYWKPTPGNAGHALSILLAWAEQHPNARWEVS